jgi:hypothetical protein
MSDCSHKLALNGIFFYVAANIASILSKVFKDLSSKTRLGVTAILRQFVEKVH